MRDESQNMGKNKGKVESLRLIRQPVLKKEH